MKNEIDIAQHEELESETSNDSFVKENVLPITGSPTDSSSPKDQNLADEDSSETQLLGDNILETITEPISLESSNDGEQTKDTCPKGCHVKSLIELIQTGFSKIHHDFGHKLAYDSTKQQQINSLHSELQKYRVDLIAKTNRPLVNGMILLHDDMGRLATKLQTCEPEELNPDFFLKAINGIQDDIEILLEQNGICTYSEPDEKFVPRRQQASKTMLTHDETLNSSIQQRLRPGFEQGSEIIKKERVVVFVYKPTEKSEGKSSSGRQEGNESAAIPGHPGKPAIA